jgi:hypothetical protein
MLLGFFRDYVSPENKSVRNIVGKIEFFDDEHGILKEEPNHEDYKKYILRESLELRDKNCSCACNCIAKRIPAERPELR